jgi:cation diffusion facilitator CzcD-associated flavoprotein CzcO
MTPATTTAGNGGAKPSDVDFDAVVVGAGFSGLYQTHLLRGLGLSVRVFEAGDGVGGTWYWNRYPGARCDSPSHVYQYWFSEELLQEWDWSERFPSQPEVLRYLNHVAEKFDLLRDIRFNTRVTSAVYDEPGNFWEIGTDDGQVARAQFLVLAIGGLSTPLIPEFEGRETFAGEAYHTAEWPHAGVDLDGKRVGVIGTGATGIQVVQEAAKRAGRLTVFQRTPNYAIAINNPSYAPGDWQRIRERFDEIRRATRQSFAGFDCDLDERSALEVDPEERRETFESLWADGSLRFWIGNFGDIITDRQANETVAEFVREKIRERVSDPATAEKLTPTDHPFGTKRVPLENGYFEAFNRDNVTLVDTRQTPIERITPKGVRVAGAEHELDVLVYATGFDAVTGTLTKIDIRGRNGASLAREWDRNVHTYLGLLTAGFPNLFMVTGPTAPSVAFCNYPTCAMQQVDWIAQCLGDLRRRNLSRIEATPEAEQGWLDHHNEVASQTLMPLTDSWWMGANIPGKPRILLSYVGGGPAYRQICEDVAARGYEGFRLD